MNIDGAGQRSFRHHRRRKALLVAAPSGLSPRAQARRLATRREGLKSAQDLLEAFFRLHRRIRAVGAL